MNVEKLKSLIDVGVSTTGFITEILQKSSIPGLSLGSYFIKRSLDTWAANEFLKEEGIKNLVVLENMCKNIEKQIERKADPEFKYVFGIYSKIRLRLNKLVKIFADSIYSDVLTKENNAYSGRVQQRIGSSGGGSVLLLIPNIISFLKTHLKKSASELDDFSLIFNRMFQAADQTAYDPIIAQWRSMLTKINKEYIEFVGAEIKRKPGAKSLQENLIQWQTYMDALASFTKINDIHLFIMNYTTFDKKPSASFNVTDFTSKYMIDPIRMKSVLQETIQELDQYIDALLILDRNQNLNQSNLNQSFISRQSSPGLSPIQKRQVQKRQSSPIQKRQSSPQASVCDTTITIDGVTYKKGPNGGISKKGKYNKFTFNLKEEVRALVKAEFDRRCRR